jgi:hypothetical protein
MGETSRWPQALAQPLGQIEPGEQTLDHDEAGEGGQLLLLEAQLRKGVGVVSYAILRHFRQAVFFIGGLDC